MIDKEKVKKALAICAENGFATCDGCPYESDERIGCPATKDALDLIKELEKEIIMAIGMNPDVDEQPCPPPPKQEDAVKPIMNTNHKYISDAFRCGACGHYIRFHANYCEGCGKKVRW